VEFGPPYQCGSGSHISRVTYSAVSRGPLYTPKPRRDAPRMPDLRPDPHNEVRIVGRYALYGRLATGGMATVHFGRLLGPVGFSRTVAIKRLHPQYAKDPEFVAMFLDEARLAARIQHPNVVATLDVVALEEELLLVMDYIRGEAFSRLLRAARKKGLEPPVSFVAAIVSGMLHGLHAAHEVTDERGQPLRVVHRDVSPQNVLVGVDGVARLLDFGVAKAGARVQVTKDGQVKGKLSYMSPEQLTSQPVDRRADLFAAGVVLWEALTGKRLFLADDTQEIIHRIVDLPVPAPSLLNPAVPPAFDAIVERALQKNPDARYSTAREFAVALEHAVTFMSPREVGEWVEEIAGDVLELREQALAELESYSSVTELSPPTGERGIDINLLVRNTAAAARAQSMGPPRPPPRKSRMPLPPSIADELPTTVLDSPMTQPALRLPASAPPVELTSEAFGFEEDPFHRQGRRKKVALGLGVGAALLGLGAWLTVGGTASSVPETGNAGAPITLPASKVVGSKTVEAATGTTDGAAAISSANAGVGAAPTATEGSKVDARPRFRPPRYVPPPKPAAPAENLACKQPYKVDADGIRRVKPECL
jgi:eukaryotic-like serine/threonine-protein kinase